MNELLNQFFDLWLEIRQYQWDYENFNCDRYRKESMGKQFTLEKLARKIESARLAQSKALPAGAHEDIPGQMYLTDLPVAAIAGDASQRGAA